MQCDIDVIGEAGPVAEVELITATAATVRALGLEGCVIRVNDRRLLTSTSTILGFAPEEFDGVLITVDKLDKIGQSGVLAVCGSAPSLPPPWTRWRRSSRGRSRWLAAVR